MQQFPSSSRRRPGALAERPASPRMRSFADAPGSSACRWLCRLGGAMAVAAPTWPSPAVAAATAGPPPQPLQLRLIALTGQQAPDTEPGVTFFNALEAVAGTGPRIDGQDSIVFAPFLAGP